MTSLLLRSFRGVLWVGSSQMAAQSLHVGLRLLLARLLIPEDFGLMAIAVVFVSLAELFLDLGLGRALVQRKDLTPAHRTTAFWSTILAGVVAAAVIFLAAPLIGRFFQTPRTVPLLRALSLSLVLTSPGSTFSALLQRELDFRALGIRQLGSVLLGGIAGVTAAFLGLGVWSLVLMNLVSSLVSTLLLAMQARWMPRGRFSRRAFVELWSFGRHVVGSRLLNFLNRNLDTILVARYLGAPALGLYAFSYQAVLLPLQYFSRPLAQVGIPSFAKLQGEPARARAAYLRTLEAVILPTWWLACLAALAASGALPLLVGDTWRPAITPFRILCMVAALQSPVSLSASLLVGTGRPETLLRWTAVSLVANTLGFIAGLTWGVTGVAAGYLAATAALSPLHVRMVGKILKLKDRVLWAILGRGAAALAALAAAWGLASHLLGGTETVASLTAAAVAGSAAYFAASRYLLHRAWSLVAQMLTSRSVRPGTSGPGVETGPPAGPSTPAS